MLHPFLLSRSFDRKLPLDMLLKCSCPFFSFPRSFIKFLSNFIDEDEKMIWNEMNDYHFNHYIYIILLELEDKIFNPIRYTVHYTNWGWVTYSIFIPKHNFIRWCLNVICSSLLLMGLISQVGSNKIPTPVLIWLLWVMVLLQILKVFLYRIREGRERDDYIEQVMT